ncbi:MAG: protein kinase [Verrucomicrobiales bacterium]|nr:protein kinase [Verrucomicrobiales bacterium]
MTANTPGSDDLDFMATRVGLAEDLVVFERFQLKRILGRGGMGVVWLGQDRKLQRDVALKFMPDIVSSDAASLNDLRKETRNGLLLSHPNIVRMLDLVEEGPSAAIVMEFVDGKTLNDLRAEQPDLVFHPATLRPWVDQLINALEYAHSQPKMVHRDLKPHNLMVNQDDQLKVADFGIASCVRDSVSRISVKANNAGTLVYMSPQQLMGEVPTFSDDIYSFGATVFELLTGRPPFYAGDIPKQIETKIPPRMMQRRNEFGIEGDPIPEAWETLIAACLEKDSGDRPANMSEVRKALDGKEFKRGSGDSKARHPVPVAGAQRTSAPAATPAAAPLLPTWWPLALVLIGGGWAGWYYGIAEPARLEKEEAIRKKGEIAAEEEAARKKARAELAQLQAQYADTERQMELQDSAQKCLALWRKLEPTVDAFNYPFGNDDEVLQSNVDRQIEDFKEQVRVEQDDYDKAIEIIKSGIAKAEEISADPNKGADPKRQMWQIMLTNWPQDDLKTDYGKQHETLRRKVADEMSHWAEAAAEEAPEGPVDNINIWVGSPVMTWKEYGRKETMMKVERVLFAEGALRSDSKPDGELDPSTMAAIKTYQQKYQLPASGRLASVTLQKMSIDFTNEPQPPPPPTVAKTPSGGTSNRSTGSSRPAADPYAAQKNARDWIGLFLR